MIESERSADTERTAGMADALEYVRDGLLKPDQGAESVADHVLLDDCPMPEEDQPEGEFYVCPAGHSWRSVGDGWVPDPYPEPYLKGARIDGSGGAK